MITIAQPLTKSTQAEIALLNPDDPSSRLAASELQKYLKRCPRARLPRRPAMRDSSQ